MNGAVEQRAAEPGGEQDFTEPLGKPWRWNGSHSSFGSGNRELKGKGLVQPEALLLKDISPGKIQVALYTGAKGQTLA